MIDLSRQNTDVGFAYRLASFLRELETDNPIRYLRSGSPDDFDLTVPTLRLAISPFRPEIVVAKMPSGTLIMIAGANNADLGILTLRSYHPDNVSTNPANANQVFWAMAAEIFTEAHTFGVNIAQPIRIIGHSLGGAVAAHLQYQYERFGAADCQSIILNSPRLGTSSFCTTVEGLKLVRYFCNDDPVQFVPCHSDEAPLAHCAVPAAVTNAYNLQTHPRRGIAIDALGQLTDRDMPAGPLPNTTLSILQWIVFSTTGPGVNHKLDEITQRLRYAADRMEPIGTVRARAIANERPATIRPRAGITTPVEVPIPAAVAQRTIMASRPAAIEQVRTNSASAVPERFVGLFRARQVSGTWTVVYNYASGPEVVEMCDGKREAKVKARRYNRMARTTELTSVPEIVSDLINEATVIEA